MKKALIANGFITNIVDIGNEFEIVDHTDIFWVLCPDNVTTQGWKYENRVFLQIVREDTHHARLIDRNIAYGSIADQLSMQYDDAINGTTTWLDHIKNVKATTLRPGDLLP